MKKVLLEHGDGGTLTHKLIQDIFRTAFQDDILDQETDAAVLPIEGIKLAVTTDSFVINPLLFPGGDIGKLAVAGTVNDLAVSGAIPRYLTVGFILEEGLDMELLKEVAMSMAKTAREAGVRIIAGDTKVVERGKCDGMFINTTGVGFIYDQPGLGYEEIKNGDVIVINGGIAEHGVAVLSERAGIRFDPPLLSDCQPLNLFIEKIMERFSSVKFMRDPTRGGVATTLKEIADRAQVRMIIEEDAIPMSEQVQGALEFMGMDPLYIANEGKVLIIVGEEEADDLVEFMQQEGHWMAARIGKVEAGKGELLLKTSLGGTRVLGMLSGAPLPRIC